MDEKYIKLFSEISKTISALAESVVEYNYNKKDTEGIKASTTMKEDYAQLYDKLTNKDFDFDTLTRADFAKLLIGAIIVVKRIEERISKEQEGLKNYKDILIPQLEKIVNESENDEQARDFSKEFFELNN